MNPIIDNGLEALEKKHQQEKNEIRKTWAFFYIVSLLVLGVGMRIDFERKMDETIQEKQEYYKGLYDSYCDSVLYTCDTAFSQIRR